MRKIDELLNLVKDVSTGFDLLEEVLEKLLNEICNNENFYYSQSYVQYLRKLQKTAKTTLKEIKSLRKNWSTKTSKRTKLKKGLKTPSESFVIPLLETIECDFGGRAPRVEVLKKLRDKMNEVLNEYDLTPLSSDSKIIRWENTVQWVCSSLRKKGLLSETSLRGMWEITEKGRRFLERRKIKDLN